MARINPEPCVTVRTFRRRRFSEFVAWFWFYEGLDLAHRRERVLPDGSTELVINLDDSRRKLFDREQPYRFQTFHRAWLSGARSDYILIDVLPQSFDDRCPFQTRIGAIPGYASG
jgi:hypothetical protein